MPILDIFEDHHNGLTGPICSGFDVTPNDVAPAIWSGAAILVDGVAGNDGNGGLHPQWL